MGLILLNSHNNFVDWFCLRFLDNKTGLERITCSRLHYCGAELEFEYIPQTNAPYTLPLVLIPCINLIYK